MIKAYRYTYVPCAVPATNLVHDTDVLYAYTIEFPPFGHQLQTQDKNGR